MRLPYSIYLIKRTLKDYIRMYPRAKLYGIRYFWDKEFRRVMKQRENSRMERKKYGSQFLVHRKKIRNKLRERDGSVCAWCGLFMALKDQTIDHITPVSLGGDSNSKNLRLVHAKCNIEKSVYDQRGIIKVDNVGFPIIAEAFKKLSTDKD